MPGPVKLDSRRHALIVGIVSVFLVSGFGMGIAATAESAQRHQQMGTSAHRTQFTLARQPSSTATPTPRVIVIKPTSTPNALPTATSAPNRAALPTATPPVIIVETAAPTRSTPTPTTTPLPTPPPTPTATAVPMTTQVPTALPTPTFPSVPPTLAPAPDVRLRFSAEDWVGGYYREDGQAYGRPWAAVYGALSDFPRATLSFTLDATPGRPATISITGLDDEWETLNPIALEVNGEQVYSGLSPFVNWDGIGNGANAAWTAVPFTIPSGVLRAGPNDITFFNLTPVDSFNAPPYVLLADAILEISGQTVENFAIPAAPTPVPIVPSSLGATFTAADWTGAFYRGDNQFYGRPWAAIYGAASAYPRATIRFRLEAIPTAPATLTLTGLDDELATLNPITIEINGQQFFTGPSPFLNWDGVGNGDSAAWTQVSVTIPVESLRQGRNEITVANLSPSGNFNAPPYVLLADATLVAPGVRATVLTPGASRPQRDRAGGGTDD